MSHEKYWDYLEKLSHAVKERFGGDANWSADYHRMVFKLTASPYHYWLENQACVDTSPKESSVGKENVARNYTTSEAIVERQVLSPSVSEDFSNLANKAQELRSKARTAIKEYMNTKEKQWTAEASTDLWRLASDWGKDMTVYKALDLIPDLELCRWNDKHEVFL